MSAFLTHWQLTTQPFEATWDTRFFFPSPSHNEALARLLYLAREGSMHIGLLTGEIGCGKTLTRAVLQASLSPSEFQIAVCENSGFPLEDLIRSFLAQLAPHQPTPSSTSKFTLCEQLRSCMEESAAAGLHTVLLLDEAQDLSPSTLQELRWLTNFNQNGQSIVTLILIGQPDLAPHIQNNPAIQQRVTLRYHLAPLCEETTFDYLAYRLLLADHPDGSVFSIAAARLIHNASQGIPREINRMAKMALELAWAHEQTTVSAEVIATIVSDLQQHSCAGSLVPQNLAA